jgi:hypothetical protein
MTTEQQIREILSGMLNYRNTLGKQGITYDTAEARLTALMAAERLDELEQQAAVTKGITDSDECMKLLVARHIERIAELTAQAKAGQA